MLPRTGPFRCPVRLTPRSRPAVPATLRVVSVPLRAAVKRVDRRAGSVAARATRAPPPWPSFAIALQPASGGPRQTQTRRVRSAPTLGATRPAATGAKRSGPRPPSRPRRRPRSRPWARVAAGAQAAHRGAGKDEERCAVGESPTTVADPRAQPGHTRMGSMRCRLTMPETSQSGRPWLTNGTRTSARPRRLQGSSQAKRPCTSPNARATMGTKVCIAFVIRRGHRSERERRLNTRPRPRPRTTLNGMSPRVTNPLARTI